MQDATFTSQLDQQAPLLRRVAWVYGRDAAERDDLVQQIALAAWRSRHRYDASRRFTTWLHRVALNVAISFLRRERRHRVGRQELTEQHLVTNGVEPDPRVAELLRAIEGLDGMDRALVLLWLEGEDHAAIAGVLGIGVSNVGTRLHRLRQRLRKQLGGTLGDSEDEP